MLGVLARGLGAALLAVTALAARAADYPAPKEGDVVLKDFRFHTGEVMPELKLHYTTIGDPAGEPVVILHGTAGSGASMLTRDFAGELFGPGQPLDARKYFIVLPDAIGAGKSAKPSDGLKARFPRYDYDDMVEAQHRLLTEGLKLAHVRLIVGNSMGGMHAWLWGIRHPGYMDGLVPMASQPAAMSGRNWMMRRLLTQAVRSDPAWKGGDYTEQPQGLRIANVWFGVATIGGNLAYQAMAPDRASADRMIEARLAQPFTADANDYLYQWESSADYDPSARLSEIRAPVLAINAADDERNPPELGTVEAGLAKVGRGRLYLIPASAETRGHGTTGLPRFWKDEVAAFLRDLPRRGTDEAAGREATARPAGR
jgi:homoserine O-acetyltransferase/O-succinyltransferase